MGYCHGLKLNSLSGRFFNCARRVRLLLCGLATNSKVTGICESWHGETFYG